MKGHKMKRKILIGLALTLAVINGSFARWDSDDLMSSQETIDALRTKKINYMGLPCDVSLALNSPVHTVNTLIQDIQDADRELSIIGDTLHQDYSVEGRVDFSFEGSAPFNLVVSSPFRYKGTLWKAGLGIIGEVYVSPSPQGPFRGSTIEGVFNSIKASSAFKSLPQEVKDELLGQEKRGLDYLIKGFKKRIAQLKGKKALYSVWPMTGKDQLTILPGAPLPKAKPAQPAAKKTAVPSKAPVKFVAKVAPQPKVQNAAKVIAKPVANPVERVSVKAPPASKAAPQPELRNVVKALGKVSVKAGLQPAKAPVAVKTPANTFVRKDLVKPITQKPVARAALKAPAKVIAKPVARVAAKVPVRKIIAQPLAKKPVARAGSKLLARKIIAKPVAKKPIARRIVKVPVKRVFAKSMAKKPLARRIVTKVPAKRVIVKKPVSRIVLRAPVKRRP
jgi:histone H1/5